MKRESPFSKGNELQCLRLTNYISVFPERFTSLQEKTVMRKYISMVLLCLIMNPVWAVIRHVPQSYPTIQSAVEAASSGDTILVSPGTYFENIKFKGKGIVLASLFLTTSDTTYIGSTIINGSQPVVADSASCVIIASPSSATTADTTAALIGFTITGGTGTRWEDEHNPGSWYREGGGILIQYLSPRISFNRIYGNLATNKQSCTSAGGGAIRCGDGNPRISNNIIGYNSGRYGGGLVFNFSGAVIRNNIISNNSGGEDFGGGGIWAYGADALSRPRIVENNTLVNNASVTNGGGIRIWSTTMLIRNNIIWGNNAPSGPQITTTGGTTVTYSDIQGGWTGSGNLNVIPQFETQNYYLASGSPCIDKGDSSIIYNDPPDLLHPAQARFPAEGSLRNDMGAYGGFGSALMGNIQTIYTVIKEYKDDQGLILDLRIEPNPSSCYTTLLFMVNDMQKVNIEVYSQAGEKVITLLPVPCFQGVNHVVINISALTCGMYFCRIGSGDHFLVKKLIRG